MIYDYTASTAGEDGVTRPWFVSSLTRGSYDSRKAAEAAEAKFLEDQKNISNIKSQVLNQWKQLGVPSIGGGLSIDERAQGLAERLYANQISDLANLKLVAEKTNEWNPLTARRDEYGNIVDYGTLTPFNDTSSYTPYEGGNVVQNAQGEYGYYTPLDRSFLKYGDRQIGFLGDIGDAANWQPSGYLQSGNLASWSSAGKGAVGYTVQQAPNGQVYFVPSWGSTSDWSSVAPFVGIGASLLAPGLGSVLASGLGTSAAVGSTLAGGLIGGTLAEASGGDFLKGALSGGLGAAAAPVAGGISEAVGGGMLGNAIGQGLTSAGMAALTGGDVEQAALLGAISGATKPTDLGMNSKLTPAQIEAGLGTPGYGYSAQAAASGLFDPAVIGSGAYTQTSYPIDMAEFAASDAMQLARQTGNNPAAIEQNLIASGIDPLIAADLAQQVILEPDLSSMDLANRLIQTYGSNIYDMSIQDINALKESQINTGEYMPRSSAAVPWDQMGKLLSGLFATTAAAQMIPQPTSIVDKVMSPYKPVDNMPVYDPAYFQSVQNYYNTYLPDMPRDVSTPLSSWYSSTDIQPDQFTASLFNNK